MANGKLWTPEEDEFVCEFVHSARYEEIAAALGRSYQSVKGRARSLGVRVSSHLPKGRAKHTVNDAYFSWPNIENSYYAGFVAADGSVSSKGYVLAIKLAIKDIEFLYKFREAAGCSANVKIIRHGTQAELVITGCPRWKADLEKNFLITPAKSLTLKPPVHLNIDCARSFIIGYLDGDGSVFYTGNGIFCISFVGTAAMLEWIKTHLEKVCPPPRGGGKVCSVTGTNCYQYVVTRKHAEEVYKVLKAHPVPYRLARKWQYEF